MRKISIKVLSLIFVLCFVISSAVLPSGAISYSNDVKTESESIILVNMDSGQVVFEKDPDSKRYPASTTKIMTYIIAVENIDDLENTRIPIKKSVLDVLEGTGSSLASVENYIGKTMSAVDLLYSMMVPSGNDAAVVLADYVGGGNIDNFVKMMNDKAKELGCKNTHFANPDGLHDKNHYTTARDLYKITTYALTLPKFSKITNTCTYYCEDDEYPLITTNYLIDKNRGGEYYYTYAKGVKTGTTDEAGRCLVTTATADGYSYMAVLLGADLYDKDGYETYGTMTDAADLFRWALTSLELKTVATSSMPIYEEKVNLAWGKDSVQLTTEKNLGAIVPKDCEEENIIVEKDVPDSVDAPLEKGQVVGKATIYYQETGGEKQELATVNLVSSEKIERSGILFVLDIIGTVFKSYWFIVLIGVIVLIVIIYFIVSKINRRRRGKKRAVKRYRNF